MLQQLVNDNLVTLTPPQDYDDSYSIKYAKLHNACIITNDRYWDHIDKQSEKEKPYIRYILNQSRDFTSVLLTDTLPLIENG